jgi:para-aminobenzoate synthetase component 1
MANLVGDLVAVDARKHGFPWECNPVGAVRARSLYMTWAGRYTPWVFITPCRLGLSAEDAARRLASEPGLAWLDGGLTHGHEGRFSFVGCRPVTVVERNFGVCDPLSALDELELPLETGEHHGVPGGPSAEDVPAWIGHLAYDASWSGRPGQRLPRTSTLPCVRFARYAALHVFDHESGDSFLVGDDAAACADLAQRLERGQAASLGFSAGDVHPSSPDTHRANVRAALERIAAGDVYEVNLARRFRAPFSGHPLGLFLRMRELSPVPLGYFVAADEARPRDTSSHAVLGRSMERFLRFRAHDREVWTSPIKGTIARGGDAQGEAQKLRADPKEHAEHSMVVDLMRNDLSRVCDAGSVRIRELMQVLPFAGLSHLVSTVKGRVRPELSLRDVLEGTFPPGSVTGAPKKSATEIIESLEPFARDIYTGALGFIDRRGGCSFAVAIRTAVVHDSQVDYWAGGGIVIDSDPERETTETELKARVFLQALRARADR